MSAANPVSRKSPKVDLDTTREKLTRLGLAHASEHVGETLAEAVKESWPPHRFLDQLRGAITQWTLWVGIIKAPFFAVIIAMVGCYEGFNVTGSSESVGRLTTQSVVESIFIVIVADAAFSILFSILKI